MSQKNQEMSKGQAFIEGVSLLIRVFDSDSLLFIVLHIQHENKNYGNHYRTLWTLYNQPPSSSLNFKVTLNWETNHWLFFWRKKSKLMQSRTSFDAELIIQ